jgi:hypothetical protein
MAAGLDVEAAFPALIQGQESRRRLKVLTHVGEHVLELEKKGWKTFLFFGNDGPAVVFVNTSHCFKVLCYLLKIFAMV